MGGAVRPGNTSTTIPTTALTRPIHSSGRGRSPEISATTIIVVCTAPKRMSAPVPVVRLRYANEKAIAYAKSANTDRHPGVVVRFESYVGATFRSGVRLTAEIASKIAAPE